MRKSSLLWISLIAAAIASFSGTAAEYHRFGSCPSEIGISLTGAMNDLKPTPTDRKTPSVLDRVSFGSRDMNRFILVGGPKTFDSFQGKVSEERFVSIKNIDDISSQFDHLIERRGMLAFYSVVKRPGTNVFVSGLRFDHVGSCIISTMFTLLGQQDRPQVEDAMSGVSFAVSAQNPTTAP